MLEALCTGIVCSIKQLLYDRSKAWSGFYLVITGHLSVHSICCGFYDPFLVFLFLFLNPFFFIFRPTPQVKHYHIKQNSKLEFYLSEKHCCATIADLVNYHR